jgi:hypothetical protein
MRESKITNRIFMILDRNGSGEVDFAGTRPALRGIRCARQSR